MGKRVLVAVERHSISEEPIFYGIELASRIKSSAVLVAISSPESARKPPLSAATRQIVEMGEGSWMDGAVAESQKKGVNLEIFFASGPFFEEVIRFVRSQPAVQFIVTAAPKNRESRDGYEFASALKHLHEEFEGEILLVEKAGKITRVPKL
ncbi:MAG TPA: hypothetical protein VMC85_08510 [Desulfomonilaceae bacterium]|nr:hypothetical protein [Desulfomonilaceae bacterium]